MDDPASASGEDSAQVDVNSFVQGNTRRFWHECTALDAMHVVRENLPAFIDALEPQHLDNLLFLNRASKIVMLDEADFGCPENWFFIGDIHADFYALHAMLQSIQAACPDFRLVFLGDLVDRGELHIESIVLLLVWAIDHPGQIAWIAGNHDIAFSRNTETGLFSSSVSPSEFVDTLNAEGEQHQLNAAIGQRFIGLTQRLPRALLFHDGLLATHGGFPLTDLHGATAGFSTREEFLFWLNSTECLQDFTWTRITRYRKRMPNRLSKGCSYGFLDFEAFCNLRPEWFPVRRMITGHDHVQEGFHPFPEYLNNPALTLTGFGFDEFMNGDMRYASYRSCLTAGRYQRDALPVKFEVPVDVEALMALHHPDTSGNEGDSTGE